MCRVPGMKKKKKQAVQQAAAHWPGANGTRAQHAEGAHWVRAEPGDRSAYSPAAHARWLARMEAAGRAATGGAAPAGASASSSSGAASSARAYAAGGRTDGRARRALEGEGGATGAG